MGRHKKVGLDYHPLDVNFLKDRKVRRVLRSNGAEGIAVIVSLFSQIYGDKGYFLDYDDDLSFDISDDLGIDENVVSDVILKLVDVEFFNEKIFKKYKVLTSLGIQKRYIEATKRRIEKTVIDNRYDLNVDINNINDNINDSSVDTSTQSKVKESKVKESKVKKKIKGAGFSLLISEIENEWEKYLKFRKVNHKFQYTSEDSEQRALKKLYNLVKGNSDLAIQVIQQTVDKGWKDFYELKQVDFSVPENAPSEFELKDSDGKTVIVKMNPESTEYSKMWNWMMFHGIEKKKKTELEEKKKKLGSSKELYLEAYTSTWRFQQEQQN